MEPIQTIGIIGGGIIALLISNFLGYTRGCKVGRKSVFKENRHLTSEIQKLFVEEGEISQNTPRPLDQLTKDSIVEIFQSDIAHSLLQSEVERINESEENEAITKSLDGVYSNFKGYFTAFKLAGFTGDSHPEEVEQLGDLVLNISNRKDLSISEKASLCALELFKFRDRYLKQ